MRDESLRCPGDGLTFRPYPCGRDADHDGHDVGLPPGRFIDRPASHAVAHAEDQPCPCHGKTGTELAAPYALFAIGIFVLALVALLIALVAA